MAGDDFPHCVVDLGVDKDEKLGHLQGEDAEHGVGEYHWEMGYNEAE